MANAQNQRDRYILHENTFAKKYIKKETIYNSTNSHRSALTVTRTLPSRQDPRPARSPRETALQGALSQQAGL